MKISKLKHKQILTSAEMVQLTYKDGTELFATDLDKEKVVKRLKFDEHGAMTDLFVCRGARRKPKRGFPANPLGGWLYSFVRLLDEDMDNWEVRVWNPNCR